MKTHIFHRLYVGIQLPDGFELAINQKKQWHHNLPTRVIVKVF